MWMVFLIVSWERKHRKREHRFVLQTAARQLSVNVLPTQTYYTFECGPVLLDVVFTAPLLLDDLDRMSMPVNYISWQVRSADQKKHEVRVSVEAFSSLAVNTEDQAVMVERRWKTVFLI